MNEQIERTKSFDEDLSDIEVEQVDKITTICMWVALVPTACSLYTVGISGRWLV